MSATLDQIKREAKTLNWSRVAKFPEPTGLSVTSIQRQKYRGVGHRSATQGGCIGLRKKHEFNGKATCQFCGKPNPKFQDSQSTTNKPKNDQ